jgi:hypothetical protein
VSIEFKIDVSKLIDRSDTIGKLPHEISKQTVAAINTIASVTYDKSRKMIATQVNLGRDKVDSKMGFEVATEDRPTATITARGRGTLLANFGAKQIKVPSSRSKSGVKNAGVSVNIKPSGATGVIERGFFMKLKTSGAIGVFARDLSGKMVHRYGPSVDQVFKGVSTEITPQVEADLQKEILAEFDLISVTS